MLKLGSQGISGLYLGDTKIIKAYLGNELVFTAGSPYLRVQYVSLAPKPDLSGTLGATQNGTGVYLSGWAADILSASKLELDVYIPTDGFNGTLIGNHYQYYYANTSGNPTTQWYGCDITLGSSSLSQYGKSVAFKHHTDTSGAKSSGTVYKVTPGNLRIVLDVKNKIFTVNNIAPTSPTWATTPGTLNTSKLLSPGLMCESEWYYGRPSSSVSVRTTYYYTMNQSKYLIRFKDVKLYNQSGVLIHHLVPIKDPITEEGMFLDEITNKIYKSYKAEYPLVAGPEVQ